MFLLLWLQNLTAYSFAKSNSFEPIQLYHLSYYLSVVTATLLLSSAELAVGLPLVTLMLHKTVRSAFFVS